MQTDPTKTIAQINRLLSAFPATGSANPDDQLRAYFEATDEYILWDLETAVGRYLRGKVPGFDGRFAPTPPMLAGQCRRAMEERLERDRMDRLRAPLPPPDDPPKDPRIADGLRKLAADLGASMRTAEAEAERRRHELTARVNARFAPDMSPEALHRRLGWEVGDRDGEDAA